MTALEDLAVLSLIELESVNKRSSAKARHSNLGNAINGAILDGAIPRQPRYRDRVPVKIGGRQVSKSKSTGLATWDPSTAIGVVLSNGNLTATTPDGAPVTVQGVTISQSSAKISGKYYFEITATRVNTPDFNWGSACFGVCATTATYNGIINSIPSGAVICQNDNGELVANTGDTFNNIGQVLQNDIIGVAVDLDNRNIWFKPVAGSNFGKNWNNIGMANPATNTSGIPVLAGSIIPVAVFSQEDANDAITANFGASTFTGAVPVGFISGWM